MEAQKKGGDLVSEQHRGPLNLSKSWQKQNVLVLKGVEIRNICHE